MAVTRDHLNRLYAHGDDPWAFRTSPYEKAKFDATIAALPRPRYIHALEIGCGNGELARRIAPRCDAYTGIDAVETALVAARRAVPGGRFVRTFLPAPLPEDAFDLIVLSEILYFLDPAGLRNLAVQIDARAPRADVIAVTWRGPSSNPLDGEEALSLFLAATGRRHVPVTETPEYRIDRLDALGTP